MRITTVGVRKRASSPSGWSTTIRRRTANSRRLQRRPIFRCLRCPDAEDQAMRERLGKMQENAFDRDYIRGQITAHQETVQLFEYEIGSGQDAQLKNFASQTLPVLMRHLEMAQQIETQLTGAAAR